MTTKKFELTKEKIKFMDKTLYRIKALRSFGVVKKGEIGGFVEKESNLSHDGLCWVFNDAKVTDNAWVTDDSWVTDNAKVSNYALVMNNALVKGHSWVTNNAIISGDATLKKSTDYIIISKIGRTPMSITAYKTDKSIECNYKSFNGTLKEFKKYVKINCSDPKILKKYLLAIEIIKLELSE